METVVELDKKGRLVIPRELRSKLPSNRLILRRLKDHIELIPLPDPKSLRGRYRLEGSLTEIEERQERRLLERV
jgi:DNA-binding transcriptional regulator/RsmH inhibitor MraZ